MASPKLPIVYDQTMKERITDFYGNASVFKNNMFYVGLYGQYVTSALVQLNESSVKDTILDTPHRTRTKDVDVFKEAFERWQRIHVDTNTLEVQLKWTCKQIKIPTVESQVESKDYTIDTIKPLQYPLLTGYGGAKNVDLTIVDDRNMMLWQFFNTLHNQFYDGDVLKPKSSFHKLGLYCAVMQTGTLAPDKIAREEKTEGILMENGAKRTKVITDVPAMVYEFNSAVITEVGGIEFSHENPGMFTFTVQIQVPNTFQSTFKTTFRGMADNTSRGGFDATLGGDEDGGIAHGSYNTSFFEDDKILIDKPKTENTGSTVDRRSGVNRAT